MRDKNQTTLLNFESQIESFLKKKTHSIEILRTAVVDNPTFLEEHYIRHFPRKLHQIRGLCILVHFITKENFKFRLLLDLEERINHFSLKEQLELKLLLYNKESCLKFLYRTQKYSSHEIFGNILNEGIKSLKIMKLTRKSRKVVFPQRKRGYHDKGSLRSSDRWLPSFDYTLTEIQNKKEYEIYLHIKTFNFLIRKLLENED